MIIMPEKLQELMDELKESSPETYYHSIHVKTYVYKMIKNTNEEGLTDYSADDVEAICKGALLHDIGKLYVRNYVLTKDTRLTDLEKEALTDHTKLGFEAVQSSLTQFEYDFVSNICMYHHERCDGSGYEKKTDLPMYVNIVAICDVYDALTSNRVYRDALEKEEALEMIERGDCGVFSKELIEHLKRIAD